MAYKPLEFRQNYTPSMTFEEIGRALGMKTATVQWTYAKAMRKLRARSAALGEVRDLISLRERTRCAPIRPSVFRARVRAVPVILDLGTED
jgi:hypothetical protein